MRFLCLICCLICASCCTVNSQTLALRDGTVSANSEGAVIDATASLVEAMRRVEQDQLLAKAVLDKADVRTLASRLADVKALWAKPLALIVVARAVHAKLKAELSGSIRPEYVQVYVTELNGTLLELYGEIVLARKRITERK